MKIPSPGESISEVEIASWLVSDGEFVKKDQIIAEIDSDKATLELPAEESGVISLAAEEGDVIQVGQVVCKIDISAKESIQNNGSVQQSNSAEVVKSTIKNVLEDCYRLDQIEFDHGELSNISKHVIVGKNKATLIDFESSSTKRRPSNVTSITQAFFIGSGIAKQTQKIYKNSSKEKIILALKNYKQEKTRENFETLLKILKL